MMYGEKIFREAGMAYADYEMVVIFDIRGITGPSLEEIEDAIKTEVINTLGEIDGRPIYKDEVKVYFSKVQYFNDEIVSGDAVAIVKITTVNRIPKFV